jgi:hypothetical protein
LKSSENLTVVSAAIAPVSNIAAGSSATQAHRLAPIIRFLLQRRTRRPYGKAQQRT